jgi:hypothetical protein
MEGDFFQRGHIRIDKITCHFYGCGPQGTIIEHDLLPRQSEVRTFTDGKDKLAMSGTSQCGHLHIAFLTN